ncbi:MAG: P-II family nitrogen regulator [Spirochaetes bacterium]|nr:P-II family nitrogen regulator [Spirochaetota bacterium]
MNKYDKLICTVVNHGLGEKIAADTIQAGAGGGTIIVGKGSSDSALLRFLSIADLEKDILLTLVTNDQAPAVTNSIINSRHLGKHSCGYLFIIDLGGKLMNTVYDHELINIIVNRGYADDIMDAARKAGATGGTILHARGTGKPDDEKFFGITIVPEKEQVLILAKNDISENIQKAVLELECLNTPGIGIMFVTPASDFIQLGKEA